MWWALCPETSPIVSGHYVVKPHTSRSGFLYRIRDFASGCDLDVLGLAPDLSLSINGVRLAARVAGLTVGAAHLNDRAASSDQEPGQASAVRAGAFGAEARVAAETASPLQQPAVPRRYGRDGEVPEWPPRSLVKAAAT
jgi:hypothetical protein